MAIDPFLLGVLCDPIDRGSLNYVESASVLYNPRRRVAYPVKGAIPVLLPDEAREVTDAEATEYIAEGKFVVTGS